MNSILRAYKTNELATYVTTIICPILIIFFTKNKEFEALIISIVGILVVPGIIFFINWFVHRKEYMYEGIIYYLSLGLLLKIGTSESFLSVVEKNVKITPKIQGKM